MLPLLAIESCLSQESDRADQGVHRCTQCLGYRLQAVGVDVDLREAVCFAVLGHLWLRGGPGSFPSTTGCRAPGPLGAFWCPAAASASDLGVADRFEGV